MRFEALGLSKSLSGKELYARIDLRLDSGATLAVRGPSGAGKSQLLRQLALLDAPRAGLLEERGELSLDGRRPGDWGARRWRAEVAYVPQQVPRLAGTPEDFDASLARFAVRRERGAGRCARELALALGLEEAHWRRPWSELSGGERQRALLATVVAREPGVLLLDEPTASLDDAATEAVEALLRGRTSVWVTHSTAQAERVAGEVLWLGGAPSAD